MSGLITLPITVVLVALVIYIIYWALGEIPLPQPIRTVIWVVVALIIVLYILNRFSLLTGL